MDVDFHFFLFFDSKHFGVPTSTTSVSNAHQTGPIVPSTLLRRSKRFQNTRYIFIHTVGGLEKQQRKCRFTYMYFRFTLGCFNSLIHDATFT